MYCENKNDMGRRKKYKTEEERKAAMKAYMADYYQKHKDEIVVKKAAYDVEYYIKNKEKIAAKHAEYYQKHKDEVLAKNAEYRANHKEEKAAYDVEYRAKNKEKMAAYRAECYQKNKDKILANNAEYRSTPFGRAKYLELNYKRLDEEKNRGECTLTAEWIEENIFTSVCHYCGETDWHKLGCDRIDNTKPHTPENCVPCCKHCNDKKNITTYEEFMRMIGKVT